MRNIVLLVLALIAGTPCISAGISFEKNRIVLTFPEKTGKSGKYTVKRSTGRFSEYHTVGKVSKPRYVDRSVQGSPYSYYYIVLDEKGDTILSTSAEQELFGDAVHFYSPSDSREAIARDIAGIHEKMFRAEMSSDRYALLFKPGDYTATGMFNIGFYTHIAGLGKVPYDVKICNIHTPPHLNNDNGTCTFWRSVENLSVIGDESYEHDEMFNWAVSQAAPCRRVYSQRTVRNQWKNGWVSGGFTADCISMPL